MVKEIDLSTFCDIVVKMSTLQDLSKLTESDYHSSRQEKDSVLSKYHIPITHFEFNYVEKCQDGKELEKILLVLRSGEEGYFPDLEATTENRLKIIKPKSKLLRSVCHVLNKNDLKEEELQTILNDLNLWVDNVSKDDKELEKRKSSKTHQNIGIRITKDIDNSDIQKDKKESRIPSTDFKAWDKYDPDTELLKMELEEKEKRDVNWTDTEARNLCRALLPDEFGTTAETKFLSNRERERGNEFFKIKEYEEAVFCYTNSINLNPGIDNLNNRALTYLKMLKYSDCIQDCQKVINLEPDNLKAHWRMAEALEIIQQFGEALNHIEFVIQKDPNNIHAQNLAERIRSHTSSSLRNTRMQITDTD